MTPTATGHSNMRDAGPGRMIVLRIVLAVAAAASALFSAYIGYVRGYFGVYDWWNVALLLFIPASGLAGIIGIVIGRTWGAVLVGV